MADKFQEFVDAVTAGAKDLARGTLGGFENQAADDTKAFAARLENDLKRWTQLLAAKSLSKQDFEDLVSAKKALAEMHALTQKGIALATLERFRSGLVNLVIDKAFTIFL